MSKKLKVNVGDTIELPHLRVAKRYGLTAQSRRLVVTAVQQKVREFAISRFVFSKGTYTMIDDHEIKYEPFSYIVTKEGDSYRTSRVATEALLDAPKGTLYTTSLPLRKSSLLEIVGGYMVEHTELRCAPLDQAAKNRPDRVYVYVFAFLEGDEQLYRKDPDGMLGIGAKSRGDFTFDVDEVKVVGSTHKPPTGGWYTRKKSSK